MTSRDFCYWLQGYFEIHSNQPTRPEMSRWNLNDSQVEMIRSHLSMVFKHEIDPSMGDQKIQAQLNALHDSRPSAGPLARC